LSIYFTVNEHSVSKAEAKKNLPSIYFTFISQPLTVHIHEVSFKGATWFFVHTVCPLYPERMSCESPNANFSVFPLVDLVSQPYLV
jgi:hypothetical protein